MNMSKDNGTIQVSFRLEKALVERMRDVSTADVWPPPPSQTEIVSKGIEMVLRKLETKRSRRAAAG